MCTPLPKGSNSRSNGSTPHGKTLALSANGTTCDPKLIEEWKIIERDFTRILTFFIGFFVSFSIKNYFNMINLIPRFDTLVMGLDTFLWVDPTKDQNNAKVKGQCSANDFRVTILRYCFLSLTMSLSRFSPKINSRLNKGIDYNKKKLLNQKEFEELIRGTNYENGTDHWLEKWATPLLWANKMANDLEDMKPKTSHSDEVKYKIKDIKEGITTNIRKFQLNLASISSINKYRVPNQIIAILVLAIYSFLIISAISNQDVYEYEEHNGELNYSRLTIIITDFPLFSIMKYLLLFGWLKTATDLQNPFGSDR